MRAHKKSASWVSPKWVKSNERKDRKKILQELGLVSLWENKSKGVGEGIQISFFKDIF